MNVLFVDQFSVLGGAQQCLLDLLPAVQGKGWSAAAVVPAGGPLANLLRARGIHVEEIRPGNYQCGRKSAGDVLRFAIDLPAQTRAIAQTIKRFRADLVYVNGPRLLIAVGLAAGKRAPVLFHAHHAIGQRSAAYLEGIGLRQSRATVAACCEAVAQPLRRWVPEDRIHDIPNGTADAGFRQRSFGRLRQARIGIIGRIAPEKGQTAFLDAAASLTGRFPEIRFVICGEPLFGDRQYYREVLRRASHLPVEFIGWQSDVGAVMRDLDLLVIASRQEGMPRILLEAFSAGLPVISYAAGGIPEVIDDKITGFLTRNLAVTLEEVLYSDPHRLSAIACNARRKWHLRYTLTAYRNRITNLMERCAPDAGGKTTEPRPRKSAPLPPIREDIRNAQ